MLKQFEVENFKNFDKNFIFNFSARDYSFNSYLVKNNIINKAIIYGPNNIGKSNLGIAIIDIISHLTDNLVPNLDYYYTAYLNLNSKKDCATFKYTFDFSGDEVIYEYKKKNIKYLLEETLYFNKKKVLFFNYFDKSNNFIDKSLKNNLNISLIDNQLSVVKYIFNNTPTDPTSLLNKMMTFVNNMLWYRSLSNGNEFGGFTTNGFPLFDAIYNKSNIDDFSNFLKDNGINYKLKWVLDPFKNTHELFVVFPNGKEVHFSKIASTGTNSLLLFYVWKITAFKNASLIIIDEFDAFLHYQSAENIVKLLNQEKSFQSILTSHNTYLMNNKLFRPDCCFLMGKNKIKNLYDCTDKEIREAHNLEKMYINGAFINNE